MKDLINSFYFKIKKIKVNLEDLDNLINRVDNGIKLKRNNLQDEQKKTE